MNKQIFKNNLKNYIKQIKQYWQKTPKRIKYLIYSSISIILLFTILNTIFPLIVDIKYSTIINSSDSSVVHAFLSSDEKWRMKTELSEITPLLEKAIIYKEDKYFYYHPGVNIVAIFRAFTNNVLQQKRTSGASTITMQVARLLNPKGRTYVNKIVEIFRAFQLEIKYSKKEILQMYLNLVPFGGNIEGVKAASVLYFEKAPNHLSLAELTALSVIPNRPNSLVIGKNNKQIIKTRNKWLKRFDKDKIFSKQDIEDAKNEPLTAFRHESPKSAPQYSFRLRTMFANKPNIYTHLDIKMQTKIQNIVKNYIDRLYYNNIKNAAALIIDNETNSIITYVASANFFNKEDAGQVDGIKAIRSPGSTLKPFLYALGFDKGFITPKLKVTDVPVSYSGYEPQNYDSKFHGLVTISDAIINSLNIIAVKVLNLYKTENFIKALKKVNFYQIKKDEDKLGLSVILGGCGVTLEELTLLYHAFANNGVYTDVNWLKSDTSNTGFNIISEASAYMLTEILTKVKRPDLPLEWQNSADLPKVAWKTGTSYGRKDAWSIGYNKKYTIGVWVGNFSAEGVQELSGAQSASPLLFEIFNTVDYKSKNNWYEQPEKIDFRIVCSESGLLPNTFCKEELIDAFIPELSFNRTCSHLKKVYISPDSSISYCTTCLPKTGYKEAYYPNHKPEMLTYYETNQIKYTKIPKHNPKCERVFAENIPKITSPVNNVEYFVDKTDTTEIKLACNAANDVTKVFWYVNDKFIKSEKPTKSVFYKPKSGKLKVSCTDDKGRNANVYITVKMINL